jgi:hypothetical protein
VKNRAAPFAIFLQKAESDLVPTALAGVRRLDCRGEGLLARVKLARLDQSERPSLAKLESRHHDENRRIRERSFSCNRM